MYAKAQAKVRGISLATYLCQRAADAARDVRRQQVRAQSETLGRYNGENPAARECVQFRPRSLRCAVAGQALPPRAPTYPARAPALVFAAATPYATLYE